MAEKSKKQKKRVLVVGDLMLDLTWTVGSRADSASTSSQSHGGVSPYFRNFPTAVDFRPGGAGLAALAMTLSDDIEVHLLSAHVGAQELDAFRACGFRRAGRESTDDARIVWHCLDWKTPSTPVTTIKWRFNSLDKLPEKRPFFFLRIDQDPPPETEIFCELPSSLGENYDAILLMDFAKNTISEKLMDNLAQRFQKAFFGVDSKRPKVLKHMIKRNLDNMFGFLNRNEAESYFKELSGSNSIRLRSAEDASKVFSKHKSHFATNGLVIKLDQQGAVAFRANADSIDSSHGETERFGDGASIGAGDFYAAGFITEFLTNEQATLATANHGAMIYAYRWIKYCDFEFWDPKNENYKDSDGTVLRELPWPQDRKMLDIEIPESITVDLKQFEV